MTITPLDMQTSVLRTADSQKQFSNKTDQNQASGVKNPEMVEKKLQEDLQNVQETDPSEAERKTSKKEDDNKKNIALRKKGKRKKEEKEENVEKKEARDGFRGNYVDIKIC